MFVYITTPAKKEQKPEDGADKISYNFERQAI